MTFLTERGKPPIRRDRFFILSSDVCLSVSSGLGATVFKWFQAKPWFLTQILSTVVFDRGQTRGERGKIRRKRNGWRNGCEWSRDMETMATNYFACVSAASQTAIPPAVPFPAYFPPFPLICPLSKKTQDKIELKIKFHQNRLKTGASRSKLTDRHPDRHTTKETLKRSLRSLSYY